MGGEYDPPCKYMSDKKMWRYLHMGRSEEEFMRKHNEKMCGHKLPKDKKAEKRKKTRRNRRSRPALTRGAHAERCCLHPGRQCLRQRHQRLHDGQWQASEERRPTTCECWRETHLVKWRERGVHITPAASTNTPHHQKLTHTLLVHHVLLCHTTMHQE